MPKPKLLKPCIRDKIVHIIQCGGDEEIDLNVFFKNLSQSLEKLNNTAIERKYFRRNNI
jgi:hypothetical protein